MDAIKVDDFEEIKQIGSGSFADVYLVRHKVTNEMNAQKRISTKNASKEEKEAMMNQAYVLEELRRSPHPNLIDSKGFVQLDECFYIYMEYCDGVDLAGAIKLKKEANQLFDENILLNFVSQLASGVAHLHKLSIIHRDVNPSNVLVASSGKLKLSGFSLSVLLNSIEDTSTDVQGTPYYMAPEVINGEQYDYHVDIWALGIVAYELAELRTPFVAANLLGLVYKITASEPDPLHERWSALLQQLVAMMLSKNPKKRPQSSAVVEYISTGQVPDHVEAEALPSSDAGVRDFTSPSSPSAPPPPPDSDEDEVDDYRLGGGVAVTAVAAPKASSGHVMISYSHSDRDKMLHVKSLLEEHCYPIWLDENDMGSELLDSMAQAVEGANAVLICYSEKYQASDNCRKEAKYADQKKKPMIFLRMQADFKPSGYLGFMMSDSVWLDFSGKQSLEDNKKLLERRLKEVLPGAGAGAGGGDVDHTPSDSSVFSVEQIPSNEQDDAAIPEQNPANHSSLHPPDNAVPSPAASSLASAQQPLESILIARSNQERIPYRDWQKSEVAEWFKESGLEAYASNFSYLDGKLLQQMVIWNQTDPASLRVHFIAAGMNFETILRMTAALQSLSEQSYRQAIAQSMVCRLM